MLETLIFAAYFAAGKLGLGLAFVHPSATAVWAPTGIALAAFLLRGYGVWPAIFAAAFLVNWTTAGSIRTSLDIAAGNTLEGLAGAYLVVRYAGGRAFVETAQDFFRFVFLAALASTVVSATVGVTGLALEGFAPWSGYGRIWLTWWLGDAAGDVLVAPFVLLWVAEPRVRWDRGKALEAAALAASLALACRLVFGGWSSPGTRLPISFVFTPLVVWAAYRFERRGTAAVLLFLAAFAIRGTLRGFGPFAGLGANDSLLLLQAFMGVTGMTALILATVISQKRKARGELIEVSRMEEELELKTEQLAAANAELSLFASLAAHELQEPLRKILSFGDLLKSRKLALDPETAQFTERMQDAAKRMQRLVEGILSLSRITTAARPLEKTDLNEVLREVLSELGPAVEVDGGRIEVGPLPVLPADGVQMRQLFANLISNACKFRKKDEALRVRVRSRKGGNGFVEIEVSDNGIGFEQQHADRIFKPFHRLVRRSDYPGSGIGLAICDRILLRHGGMINARSKPGEGATFTFTLPA